MLQLVETLVAAFTHAIGLNWRKTEPPIDVYRLAALADAETIFSRDLEVDGQLDNHPWRATITLRSLRNDARQRFTLAHELGHLVLAEPDVRRAVQRKLGDKPFDTERMCNLFAAELLMPRHWIVPRFRREAETFVVLHEIKHRADVNVSAAMTRLVAVLGWHSSLLYFDSRLDWAPKFVAGSMPAGSSRRIALGQGTAQLVSQLARSTREGSEVTEEFEIIVGGRPLRLEGEFFNVGVGLLCLAPLRDRWLESAAARSLTDDLPLRS